MSKKSWLMLLLLYSSILFLAMLLANFSTGKCCGQEFYHASPRTSGQYLPGFGDGGSNEVVIKEGQRAKEFGNKVVTKEMIDEWNAPADYSVNVNTGEVTPLIRNKLTPEEEILEIKVKILDLMKRWEELNKQIEERNKYATTRGPVRSRRSQNLQPMQTSRQK